MSILNMLGGKFVTNWGQVTDELGPNFSWVSDIMGVISTVLWVALALVGAAGGIYALYVGIKMAKADSAEARDENKKRLVNIIITIVVTLVLIIFFNTLLPGIITALSDYQPGVDETAIRLFIK